MSQPFAWTPNRVEYLRAHYPLGTPAQEIATQLGTSRFSVIGKANQLQLKHPKADDGGHSKRRGAPVMPRPPRGLKALIDAAAQRPTGCEWPLWGKTEAPTHQYCGKRRARRKPTDPPNRPPPPYCDEHMAEATGVARKPLKLPKGV